jgi:hypothetical protein
MAIFISYSRRDRKRVERLAADIHELGKDAWFDAQIHGGDQWWPKILENIRDAELFVVALSPHWVSSQACRAEYDYACQVGRTVVPVSVKRRRLRSTPASLEALQIVSYERQDKQDFVELKKTLEAARRPAPLPFPVPSDPPAPPGQRSFRLIAGIVTAAAALVVIGALLLRALVGGSGRGSGESTQTSVSLTAVETTVPASGPVTTVDLPGTEQWLDAKLPLKAGDQVLISAAGTVWHSPDQATGPDGDPNTALAQFSITKGNHAALLAKVGPEGAPIVVGTHGQFVADRSGSLWLGINDVGTDNNHGNFDVTVRIIPPG